MKRLLIFVCTSLIVYSSFAQNFYNDNSMDFTGIYGGGQYWHNNPPSINFIKNANLNGSFVVSCDNYEGYHTSANPSGPFDWYETNAPANGSYMSPLWHDSITWPYEIQYYCDILESYPNYYYPFYQGLLQTELISSEVNGDLKYNYILFQFTQPLGVGTHFRFEMDVVSVPSGFEPVTYSDQIGVAIVHDLPNQGSQQFLGNQITPQFQTPTGIPIQEEEYHAIYDFIGNGENFLIIGIFQPMEELTTIGFVEENPVNYLFDNFRVFRPDCPNNHININQNEVNACVGHEVTLTAQSGVSPYSWYMDGELLSDTLQSIDIIMDSLDHVFTVACDTGTCRTSASVDVQPMRLEISAPSPQTLICDFPLEITPEITYENRVNSALWQATISDSLGNIIMSDDFYNLNINLDFSTLLASTYYFEISNVIGCMFTDSIQVLKPGELLTDEEGEMLYSFETSDEHCTNSQDGYIAITQAEYPIPLSYSWNGSNEFANTPILDSLAHGNYSVLILDSLFRCSSQQFELLQLMDGCGIISGNVWVDFDLNCEVDSTDNPFQMSKIIAEPIGNFAFTDSLGHYEIYVPIGNYSVVREETFSGLLPYCGYETDLIQISQSGEIVDMVNFGDSLDYDQRDLVLLHFCGSGSPVLSNDYTIYTEVANYSSTQVNGQLLIYPIHPQLEYQYDLLPFPYSIEGDTLFCFLENINPWETVEIEIPTFVIQDVEAINDVLEFNAKFILDIFEEENVQNNDATYSTFIRAAYDPNIKTAIPNGYREQHYIDLNQDRIEYIVEFQNTGNYPAQNIVIVDSLSSLFDHSSIEILGTSHYMEIAYYDSELKFIFPNILLVDSTTNEPESHGFVHYSIALQPDLPAYTEIQNKALIYFDFNEAIVTNTTLNTLYDCESFSPEFQLESVIDCPISEISAAFNSDFIDSNEWWIDNTLHTNGINFNAEVTSGLHAIQHIISNELCGQKTHAIEIDINSSIPLDLSSINGTIFANSTLNAIIYYWYVDGELITTTDVGMLSTTVSGSYAVTAIDPDGCLASSHDFEYIYTSLGEIGKSNLSIYPNPTTGIINLNIPASITNTILHIIDPTGATVKTVSCTGREVAIDCSDLSDGVYILRVENQETHGESRFVLFH